MLEIFISMILTSVLTICWGIVGMIAVALPYARTHRIMKRRSRLATWISGIALALSLVWGIVIMELIFNRGWLFAEGIVKSIVPLMLISYWPIMGYTWPRLRGLKIADSENPTKESIARAAHPKIAIPIFAAAATSCMSALSNIFLQPVQPSLDEIVRNYALILLLISVPSWFAVKRYHALLKGELRMRKPWRRMMRWVSIGILTAAVALVIIAVQSIIASNSSKLPEASDMMNHDLIDEGGGTPTMMSDHVMAHHHSAMVQVANLTGELSAPSDVSFELIAQQKEMTLSSGAKVHTWTYNGEIAPELRVRQGEMIEVKLINKDIDNGVTIHWHGYNVPNAMDGVPGMTQNAVQPGESFKYKFRAKQAGTYWFHSHQQASEQVANGLFGVLIVDPSEEDEPYDEEFVVINHRWETDQGKRIAFGDQDIAQTKQMKPGETVKLRIINTHNLSREFLLQGVDYRVTSIDGVPIEAPDRLTDQTSLRLGSGGRYDVAFIMPDHPVLFKIGRYDDEDQPGIVFYTDVPPESPIFKKETEEFDPSQYGKPLVNELTPETTFDREFQMILGNRMGFYDGRLRFLWTINGEVYPNTPTFVVKQGEKIKTTFVNRSLGEHPMHLHGHHMTVLKKNGERVKTPWMTDTLNVQPDETYEVAFIADNPGMWMDHCHNLDHAKNGMILHLMYDHVLPSYEMGARSGNLPE